MNLSKIASYLAKEDCPVMNQAAEISGFCIDSRLLAPGNLFIALRGENFDGHDFVPDAEAKGAVGAIVERFVAGVNIPQFVVADCLQALAEIACQHRQSIHCPIIALTGSNGKTTVKEMIAAILPAPAHATKGNLNNHIGAPLSVLGLNSRHRYAVFELGANHPREIAHTAAIVRPDVALINNIAPAHIEGFGSIDGVAIAKGEIYQGLRPGGCAIINDDDDYAHFWDELLLDKKVLRFSIKHAADIYATDIRLENGCGQFTLITPAWRVDIRLQVPGMHNVHNALAAAAATYAVGIADTAIQEALNSFTGVRGRMTFLKGKNQASIIDDTYNANLSSVLMALEVLAKCQGKKIFVFGDMGELGQWTEQHHREVGISARQLGIDMLLTCGVHAELTARAFGGSGRHFPSKMSLLPYILNELAENVTVLVKGSRASAMEKIVYELLN